MVSHCLILKIGFAVILTCCEKNLAGAAFKLVLCIFSSKATEMCTEKAEYTQENVDKWRAYFCRNINVVNLEKTSLNYIVLTQFYLDCDQFTYILRK